MKTAIKQQEFTFHRVGFIDADDKEQSCWLLLIDTKEKLAEWHKDRAYQLANMYLFDIAGAREGHCRTSQANAFQQILNLYILNSGRKRISMPEAVNYIEQVATKTIFNLFLQDGEVYVSANGACRDTHLRNDGKLDEYIFETCTNKDSVFPTLSTDDVRIQHWDGAKHFYIAVNGNIIEIDGKTQYKTIERAQEVMDEYIKRNRFKNN